MGVRNPLEDAWFYTHKGGRHGPVRMQELKKLAESGGLDPRYDMCWTRGMADWRPAGEIDGLFQRRPAADERRPPGIAASLTGKSATWQPPKPGDSELVRLLREAEWPGVSRMGYLFVFWVLPVLLMVGFAFLVPFLLNAEGFEGLELLRWISVGGVILLCALVVVFSLQRLTNLGMSRWWILGHLLPVLNLWVAYRSFCCPPGFAYHGKLDRAGMCLAVVFWGGAFLMFTTFAVTTATNYGLLSGGVFDDLNHLIKSYSYEPEAPWEYTSQPTE